MTIVKNESMFGVLIGENAVIDVKIIMATDVMIFMVITVMIVVIFVEIWQSQKAINVFFNVLIELLPFIRSALSRMNFLNLSNCVRS